LYLCRIRFQNITSTHNKVSEELNVPYYCANVFSINVRPAYNIDVNQYTRVLFVPPIYLMFFLSNLIFHEFVFQNVMLINFVLFFFLNLLYLLALLQIYNKIIISLTTWCDYMYRYMSLLTKSCCSGLIILIRYRSAVFHCYRSYL